MTRGMDFTQRLTACTARSGPRATVPATECKAELLLGTDCGQLLQQPQLKVVASVAAGWVREFQGSDIVFTDNKAPVEQVVHKLIINFIRGPLGQ